MSNLTKNIRNDVKHIEMENENLIVTNKYTRKQCSKV